MEERLLDIEDLPKPPRVKPLAVPRDVFDARFEITDVFGPSHPIFDEAKSVQPEIAEADKLTAVAQSDRGNVTEKIVSTTETFETGGFEQNEVGSGLKKEPSITVSSGFDFAPSVDSQRSANAWKGLPNQSQINMMSCFSGSADTTGNMNSNGFGCSNEAIARLGRPRGRGGNRNMQRRKRRSRANTPQESAQFSSSPRSKYNNNIGEDVKTSSPKNPPMNAGRSFEQPAPLPRSSGRQCRNCGEEDHFANQCPYPRFPSNHPACVRCSRRVTHTMECQIWRDQNSREGLRCYNCNNYGHMAIRCTRPPAKNPRRNRVSSTRTARKERRRLNTENGRKEPNSAQNKPATDFKGLDVICRLMKDKHLREETAKTTPNLYDEMLSLMIDHVSLNFLPSGKK